VFSARIEHLKRKFEHVDYIVEAADFIVPAVRVRFAEQNDHLAQVADLLGTRGDHASVVNETMESVSGVEGFYEALFAEKHTSFSSRLSKRVEWLSNYPNNRRIGSIKAATPTAGSAMRNRGG
jgi:hypothetical protein